MLATADTVGGVWTYTVELAAALAAEGVEVVVAAFGTPSASQRAEALAVPGLRLHECEYRLPWMDAPWDDVAVSGRWLLGLAEREAPDVVHLSEPVHASLPWPAPVVAVAHSCVCSWWEAVLGEPAPPAWDRYRAEMRRGLAAADAVVAPSRAMVAALARHYGVRGGRAIPNGRDPARFRAAPKERFVLAAGRLWDPAKNVAALAAVADRVAWPIFVAGDTRAPDGSAVETGALRLLGRLESPDVAGWLARAGVYALPARYEPFGLSALEAGLSGCALVLGDLPSLRETWDGAALFVPPDEPTALAEALTALAADPELRARLGARAEARALLYGPGRLAAAYLALYRELLARPDAPRGAPGAAACAS